MEQKTNQMMKKLPKTDQGFSLLELMVVITIIALLATMTMPAYQAWITRAGMTKDISNQKQIITALRLYAFDNDGYFPKSEDGAEFSTSTEAYDYLIFETDLGTEEIFFTKSSNPEKMPPNNDGELLQEENCMAYVTGFTDSSPARCPIVADEMDGPGTFGSYHPWLKQKTAIVGFVGGHVRKMKLTGRQEGATVTDGDVEDIFQPGEVDEEGKITGGYLLPEQTPDDVLLP